MRANNYYAIPVVIYVLSLVLTLFLCLPTLGPAIASLDNSEIMLNDVYPFTTIELATVHSLGLGNTELFDVYHLHVWGYRGFSKDDNGALYQETSRVTLGSPKGNDLLWWIYLGESPIITLPDDSRIVLSRFTEVFELFSTEFRYAVLEVHIYALSAFALSIIASVSTFVMFFTNYGKKTRRGLNASLMTRMFILFSAIHLLLVYILLIHKGPQSMDQISIDLESRTGIRCIPSDSIKTLCHAIFVLFLIQVVWGIHHDRVRLSEIANNYKVGAQTTPNGTVLMPYGYTESRESKPDVEKSD